MVGMKLKESSYDKWIADAEETTKKRMKERVTMAQAAKA